VHSSCVYVRARAYVCVCVFVCSCVYAYNPYRRSLLLCMSSN
jgi:hypothetical protein